MKTYSVVDVNGKKTWPIHNAFDDSSGSMPMMPMYNV